MYTSIDYPNVQQIRLSVCDATDFREAAEVVKTAALQLPGVDAVGIYAFDYRRDFHLVSCAGVTDFTVSCFKFFAADSPQAMLVMRGDPIYLKVLELPPERKFLYERENITAIAIYPVKHKQHVVGSLHIATRSMPVIPPELLKQIEVFVGSLANVIARITFEAMMQRAYEEVEQKVTQRTQELEAANALLRESEAKFRSVAENSRVMIAISQNYHLVYVNPYICEVSGYTKDELLSMDLSLLVHPEQRELALNRIISRLRGDPMKKSYEYLLLSKSGKQHWVEVTPVQMEYNGLPALAIVAIDVTERKINDDALKRSEFILKQAGKIAHLGAWELELTENLPIDQSTLQWSDEVFRIFGYEPGSVKVCNSLFFERVHKDDRVKVTQALDRALRERQPYQIEHRIILPDDTERTVVEYAHINCDEHGNPLRMVGAVQDITERKQSENAIRRSESRFRQLADSMPQLVWTADARGNVDYYNEQVADFEGSIRNANGAWCWNPNIHPDDKQGTIAAWQRAVSTRESYQFEHRIRLRTGAYRWHLTRANAYADESGTSVKWYGTTTDIHDEREAQQALKDAHRRKDDFLAMLGHELRNPLAPVRNAVHILNRVELTEPAFIHAREMLGRQVTHMARLLDDLLDVSRISRGKIQLKNDNVNLNHVLKAVGNDHRALLEKSGVNFEMSLPEEPVWVYGDAARLQQILDNLLNNAVKFTDSGGKVSLNLSLDHQWAKISICDTGIGIEPAMLGCIFETFSQAESSLDRSRGGLGLGLALVKGLTELHHGYVTVESPGIGQGSTFSVCIPIVDRADVAQPECVEAPPAHLHRVLIIEDNIDAADSLQIILSMSGHDVRVAFTGQEGLQLAREFLPEVVLCDIGLPDGMNGYTIARALRSEEPLASAFLIAMTGFGQGSDRARALEAGFDCHITKPADPEALNRLVSR
jgi:PAS domain S-box-containing protein